MHTSNSTAAPPRLIAFCSPAMGSGKSTAARHLVETHGFVKVAFATPIKAMTVAMLQAAGIPDDEITARVFGDCKEEIIPQLGVSSRQIQQQIGEAGRKLNPDLWRDIGLSAAQVQRDQGNSVVIDDMRFPNEYEGVLEAGGEPYRIVRPDAEVTVAHESEGGLDLVHMVELWNIGSPEYLLGMVSALL